MTTTSTTIPARHRKIARLEAQISALREFLDRDRNSEYMAMQRNADMAVRMAQAVEILQGRDD